MRLVCPNCSAQYEVDASMIPDEGRDVQCSNCGHTWFELGAAPAEVATYEPEPEPEPEPQSEPEPVAAELAEEEPTPERTRSHPRNLSREVFEADDDDDGLWSAGEKTEETEAERDAKLSDAVQAIAAASAAEEEDEGEEAAESVPPAAAVVAAATPRRPADAAALDILKEEAERELSRRRAPASDTLETQTDLGLDEVRKRNTPSRALRARMAHLGEDGDGRKKDGKPAELDEDYEAPRRDLLPDIDEINSTLKPASRRSEMPPEAVARQRSGFRAGFLLMMLAVIGAIFVYAQAPAISRALPQAELPLIRYVDAANALRDWIDGLLANG